MSISIQFLGAADTVTGSCHLVRTPHGNVLVDCGMFQGGREISARNADDRALRQADIDAVVLTHAHVDHCGRLPLLARMNWSGPIFATSATRALAKLVLLDAAGLQEDQATRARRRKLAGKPYDTEDLEPLFTTEDVLDLLDLFERSIDYEQTVQVIPGIEVTFRDAGHILGSAFVEMRIARDGEPPLRLTFSGDLGNLAKPIVHDPDTPSAADVVVLETTYGDRDHRSFEASVAQLRGVVQRVVRERGCLLIPSFALERTQELLYVLHGFWKDGLLDQVPVFVDSPMATDATHIFTRFPAYFDPESHRLASNGDNPFRWGRLEYTRDVDASKRINCIDGPLIVIASSGMCTGGRIVHHLRQRLSSPKTTVAFLGYQAHGTLGRRLVDGLRPVRIYGQEIDVRAEIVTIGGFSAHAGQSTLLKWLEATGPAPRVILVHGEQDRIASFSAAAKARFRTEIIDPGHLEQVTLDR